MSGPPATLTALQVDLPEADHVLATVERARLAGVRLLRPAHVSLAYPWVPAGEAFARLAELERTLASWSPFPVELRTVAEFPARHGRSVVYLEPSPAEPLRALARDTVGAADGYRPHLSLARITLDQAGPTAREAIERLVRPLLPISATARTVQLCVQYEGRWWRIEHVLHLGRTPAAPDHPPYPPPSARVVERQTRQV